MRVGPLATTGALLAGALVGVTACGQDSGCVHTAIAVRPVPVTSSTAPLTMRATLTSNGDPLAKFRLTFSLVLTGPTSLVGKSGKTLQLAGYATTNGSGAATFTIPDGVSGIALPGEKAVGYEAGLTTGNAIDGKQYCDVHEQSRLT